MASVRAAQGSSSDLKSRRRYLYDVYLSFRGDTRKNFTDHLYTALINAGFNTFLEDGLLRGEDIRSGLQKAIQLSRTSVVVLSKGYASSRWCLEELVMILQLKRTTSDHVVLPVFYDVSPSDVRKQTGSFAEAFAIYEENLSPEKVVEWREALQEVASLAGMDIQNQADGNESKIIQNIVNAIGDELGRKPLSVEPRLELFNSHSLGQDHLVEESMEHSNMVVQHGGRLPLALQVIPNGEIMNEVRVNVDSSQDDHDHEVLREDNAKLAEWIFLVTSLCMEILSAACDQASSPSRPRYALFSMLFAIAALLTCIWELIYKGMKNNVVWGKGECHMLFGSGIELFGLVGGIAQCVSSIIQYVYYIRRAENPIKISLLPTIFLICLIATRLCRKRMQTTYETGEAYTE